VVHKIADIVRSGLCKIPEIQRKVASFVTEVYKAPLADSMELSRPQLAVTASSLGRWLVR